MDNIHTFDEIFNDLKNVFDFKKNIEQNNSNTSNSDIAYLENIAEISYYVPIQSHRKYLAFFIIFYKKVIRKLLKFLLEPAFKKISLYNKGSCAVMMELQQQNKALESELLKIQAELKKIAIASNIEDKTNK